jgi:GNAT superfamily N-acetyltransferase
MISAELREYALTPDRFTTIAEGSSVSRHDDGRICVLQGSIWASISAPRFDAHELDDVIADVHRLVPAGKHQVWWISDAARPANLVELLRERGFAETQDSAHELRAVVLTTPPGPIPPGVEMRRIETFEDFLAAREVQWEGFETPEERRALQRTTARRDFEESIELEIPAGFLALLDDRPAGTGMAVPSPRGAFLIAGTTAPWARGRGLYRALVRARWDYAAERGTPALVVQAVVDTSFPILQRLGFETVGTVLRFEEARAPHSA